MNGRVLSGDAWTHELEPLPLDPESVTRGTPEAFLAELAEIDGTSVGIWSLGEGSVTDTEVDEIFVVLDGAGSVAFEDGTTIDLARGVVVHLRAGDRTTWTVTQPLRKVYVGLP